MSVAVAGSTRSESLRVLYIVYNYPQLSESYIEAEIAFMRRAGVHVEVWRHDTPQSPYPASAPVHTGGIDAVLAQVRPHLVHVHWMLWGEDVYDFLGRFGLPITVRAHTDFSVERARMLAAHPAVGRVYLFPHQFEQVGLPHPKLVALPVAYDESRSARERDKDPALVLRASAAQPWRRLETFVEVAALCPDHRFILCLARSNAIQADPFVDWLVAHNAAKGNPVEIRFDVPHLEVDALMQRAATYLHTAAPDGGAGMPISLAEAMGSGCRVLVNAAPVLRDYVGDSGDSYADIAHAAELIRESLSWTAEAWCERAARAEHRARTRHAATVVLPTMLEDWRTLVARSS